MTRTTAREIAVRLAFGLDSHPGAEEEALAGFFDSEYYSTLSEADGLYDAYPDEKQLGYISALVLGVAQKREELDEVIEKYSHSWKVTRITRTALAILRCAVYEVRYIDDVPAAAAINEAVELAKSYEEPETVAFINGVLGGMMRGEAGEENAPAEEAENESETAAEDAPPEADEAAETASAQPESVSEAIENAPEAENAPADENGADEAVDA